MRCRVGGRLLSVRLYLALLLVVGTLAAGVARTQMPPAENADNPYCVQKISLRFLSPNDVMNRLGWVKHVPANEIPAPLSDKFPNSPSSAVFNLPEGVKNIYAFRGDNSLLVIATPQGQARVKALVQPLDTEPSQVTVQVFCCYVPTQNAEMQRLPFHPAEMTSGPKATLVTGFATTLFDALTKSQVQMTELRPQSTSDDVILTFDREHPIVYPDEAKMTIIPSGGLSHAWPLPMTVRPHVNLDQTVTLSMTVGLARVEPLPFIFPAPIGVDETARLTVTVPRDHMAAITLPLPPAVSGGPSRPQSVGAEPASAMSLLIFITPSVTDFGGDLLDVPVSPPPPVGR